MAENVILNQSEQPVPPKKDDIMVRLRGELSLIRKKLDIFWADPTKKRMVIVGVAIFVVLIIGLLILMIIVRNANQAGVLVTDPSPTPNSSSITPDSLEGRVRDLESKMNNFDLEERPLLPPDVRVEIDF